MGGRAAAKPGVDRPAPNPPAENAEGFTADWAGGRAYDCSGGRTAGVGTDRLYACCGGRTEVGSAGGLYTCTGGRMAVGSEGRVYVWNGWRTVGPRAGGRTARESKIALRPDVGAAMGDRKAAPPPACATLVPGDPRAASPRPEAAAVGPSRAGTGPAATKQAATSLKIRCDVFIGSNGLGFHRDEGLLHECSYHKPLEMQAAISPIHDGEINPTSLRPLRRVAAAAVPASKNLAISLTRNQACSSSLPVSGAGESRHFEKTSRGGVLALVTGRFSGLTALPPIFPQFSLP